MAAPDRPFVQLFGVELSDPERYARYRARMTPILQRFGADFEYDLRVAEVLRQPGTRPLHRVFSIVFPERSASEAFFAAPDYRVVRAEDFDPSVRSVTLIDAYLRVPPS